MDEAPKTLYEVYQTIEELFGSYGERRIKELLTRKDMTNEALHVARGKAQATEELVTTLRNTLGYDPHSL